MLQQLRKKVRVITNDCINTINLFLNYIKNLKKNKLFIAIDVEKKRLTYRSERTCNAESSQKLSAESEESSDENLDEISSEGTTVANNILVLRLFFEIKNHKKSAMLRKIIFQ